MAWVLKAAESSAPASRTDPEIADRVARIIADVRREGDTAVHRWSGELDGWRPDSFRLGEAEIARIVGTLPGSTLDDLVFVQKQVRDFAQAQRDSLLDVEVETLPGVVLGHRHVPVSATGAYVPGGRYPLTASAHMTIIPAKVAGVRRVVATTPPTAAAPPPVTVAAMHLAGADEILVLGGAHAVAALALGTESIGRVDLVTGPGNAYVAEAKRQLFGEVGIDLVAGPTETLIVADEHADPFTVAVDLLSQAEHGPDSPCVLVTTSADVGRAVVEHVEALLPGLPTGDIAGKAWAAFGEVHVVADLDEAWVVADSFASEHVQVLTRDPRAALSRMRDYGALFLGEGTCVPYGDKVIGTNHVLPTRGAARYTGGLWIGKFLKTVTYQEVTDPRTSAQLGELCGRVSRLENFEGHARSGDLRAARFGPAKSDAASLTWTDHVIR